MGNKRGGRGAIPPQGGTTVGAPAKCISILWGRAPRNFWYFWLQKYEENVPRYAAGISSPLAKDEANWNLIYYIYIFRHTAEGKMPRNAACLFLCTFETKSTKSLGGYGLEKALANAHFIRCKRFRVPSAPEPPVIAVSISLHYQRYPRIPLELTPQSRSSLRIGVFNFASLRQKQRLCA